jgi:hypothetical protein
MANGFGFPAYAPGQTSQAGQLIGQGLANLGQGLGQGIGQYSQGVQRDQQLDQYNDLIARQARDQGLITGDEYTKYQGLNRQGKTGFVAAINADATNKWQQQQAQTRYLVAHGNYMAALGAQVNQAQNEAAAGTAPGGGYTVQPVRDAQGNIIPGQGTITVPGTKPGTHTTRYITLPQTTVDQFTDPTTGLTFYRQGNQYKLADPQAVEQARRIQQRQQQQQQQNQPSAGGGLRSMLPSWMGGTPATPGTTPTPTPAGAAPANRPGTVVNGKVVAKTYTDANGNTAIFGGVDAQGKEIWQTPKPTPTPRTATNIYNQSLYDAQGNALNPTMP